MTEPTPSPIPSPAAPSDQPWFDWLTQLNHLWKEQPFVAFILGVFITAALSGLSWVSRQAWKRWKRRHYQQRIAKRRKQLPPVHLPFTVNLGNRQLTLTPAQPQGGGATEHMSIVRLLSAKSTPVPFLDRAETLTRLETWAQSEERFAIHVLGGDGGSGKTRLGIELCRRLTDPTTCHQGSDAWKAGFLERIETSDNTSSSDDASSLLLVVDYAETQPEMAMDIINTAYHAVENPKIRRVRIVFLVRRPSPLAVTRRGSNEWIDILRPQEPKNEHLNRILDQAATIILNDEELSHTERKILFTQAFRSFANSPDSLPSTNLTERLSDPAYSQPLLVTIDAFLNAHPLSNPQIACSPSELFEEVLHHEEHYWAEHWPSTLTVTTGRDQQDNGTASHTKAQDEKRRSLNWELARQAVAAATIADIQGEEEAISLLQLLPANPGNNTKDLAKWLRDCYPPHTDEENHPTLWCDHLEPDRIGEHLVASAADDLAPLLRELLSPSRVGQSPLRTWTVLERTSTDPHLNEHVGRILNDVLVEVTQAVHAQTVNTENPDLAAAFAKLFSAVRSHIEPDEAHEAEQSLSNASYLTIFLEHELAQRAAEITRPTDGSPEIDRATYASRRLSLSRYLAASGRRDEALQAAQEATTLYRTLAQHNPATHTPKLAMSLNNLANRLDDNGQQREALKTAQEAVTIRRNLAEHNPAAHTPNLASSLNNLAIYLDSNGQQREALQTAQEAVTIRRNLAEHNPGAHTPALASSLKTYANVLERSGNTKETARIRQVRDEVLKRMKETEEGHD